MIPTDSAIPILGESLRAHLGHEMQVLFAPVLTDALPDAIQALIERFEAALAACGSRVEAAFQDEMVRALPAMRGFAMSLTMNAVRADDLVQETLLKAWAHRVSFVPGTNFVAWTFTILRNQFYSEQRKRQREVEDVDGEIAASLAAKPDQDDRLMLKEVWRTMARLPESQREALILVAVNGLSYDAAAAIMGCQVGTVKSRVSRARSDLGRMLGVDHESNAGVSA